MVIHRVKFTLHLLHEINKIYLLVGRNLRATCLNFPRTRYRYGAIFVAARCDEFLYEASTSLLNVL